MNLKRFLNLILKNKFIKSKNKSFNQKSSMQLEKLIEKDKKLYSEYTSNFVNKFGVHLLTGTSGIRHNAQYLDYPCWRTAIFLSQVARLDCSKVLGIMITASHNPKQDNGIKCTDFIGEMLRTEFEEVQNVFIKEENLEKGLEFIRKEILRIGKKESFDEKLQSHIYLGCDTRVSSPHLSALAQEAIALSGNCSHFFGQVTTPQLHHFVYIFNSSKYNKNHANYNFDSDLENIKADYYTYYAGTFLEILKTINITGKCKQFEKIYVDCSNGVGGVRVPELFEKIKHIYDIEAVNDKDTNNLNIDCGAEFVQKERKFCTFGMEKLQQCHKENKVGAHFASYDGDSDRIVFFYTRKEEPEKIIILDGDFIMTLLTQQTVILLNKIKESIKKLKDSQVLVYSKSEPEKWIIGNGLTGYTNGSCFSYLENKLGSKVKLSANGVKNLHHTCLDFDMGVYFEANGHGTIAINNGRLEELEEFSEALKTLSANVPQEQKTTFDELELNVKQLALYLKLSNQAVGDAISDFLLVEAALLLQGLTMDSWFNLYKELPNKTSKVVIKNRFAIEVNKLQLQIIKPKEVQDAIDEEVKKVAKGRGFARPSGTEDIVRIYVEAESEADVIELEKKIGKIISDNKEIN